MNGERPVKPFASWWARDVIRSCRLSGTARLLLMTLAAYANAAHYCNPSVDLLAESLGVTKRNVQKARAELVSAGLVVMYDGGQGRRATNGYWLPLAGQRPKGVGGDTLKPPKLSTRVSVATPLDIHKGVGSDALRVSVPTPEVDSEVSRESARVDSPPLRTKSGKKLLRPDAPDWCAT